VRHRPSSFRDQPRRWCVRDGTKHPWQIADDVRDHEHVMRIVVVGRGDVDPTATTQRPDNADCEEDDGP
jgi:hypothetical protein